MIKNLFLDDKKNKWIVIGFFIAYFFLGACIFRDYGISSDEMYERQTMWVNVNYLTTTLLGKEPMDVEPLTTYADKYYGSALQLPAIIIEVLNKDVKTIMEGRHFYSFCLCMTGYVFFFFLCKKLFKSNMLSLLGTSMLALYPRFFAEQFYNIKDTVFMAVFIVGMWATVQMIESKFKSIWILFFCFISGLATTTRMPAIILVMVVIGYLWIAFLLKTMFGDYYDLTLRKTLMLTIVILGLFYMFFVLFLPGLWEAPVKNTIEFFTEFSNLTDGQGLIVFMGEEIGEIGVPWYYIPIWLLISMPLWYIICFVVSGVIVISGVVNSIKKKEDTLTLVIVEQKYWLWSILLAFIPWFGMAVMGSTLYNGWRHCYFLVPPMVLFSLFGIDYVINKGNKYLKIIISTIIGIGLIMQISWIGMNHPNEMVYFNNIGKHYAHNFDRDYWHLSEYQAWKYIAEHDDSDKISINSSATNFFRLRLNEEELKRVELSDEPMYYIDTYRGRIGNDFQKEGYEEYHSIMVDGFKVATIFKKINY